MNKIFKGIKPSICNIYETFNVDIQDANYAPLSERIILYNTTSGWYSIRRDQVFIVTDKSRPEYTRDSNLIENALLHELVHWTGGYKRLNRFIEIDKVFASSLEPFDSSVYAEEEWIAQLGVLYLANKLKLDKTYYETRFWAITKRYPAAKNKPRIYFEAEKAANYILGVKDV